MTISRSYIQQMHDAIDAMIVSFCDQQALLLNQRMRAWLQVNDETITPRALLNFVHRASRRDALMIYRQILDDTTNKITTTLYVSHPNGVKHVTVTLKRGIHDYWTATVSELGIAHDSQLLKSGQTNSNSLASFAEQASSDPLLQDVVTHPALINDALDRFLRNLKKIIPFRSASVGLIEGNYMTYFAARGIPDEVNLKSLSIHITDVVPNHVDEVFHAYDSQAFIIHDVTQNPDWLMYEGTEYIRSWMGVLMRFHGRLIGMLNLDHDDPHFFTQEMAEHVLGQVEYASLAVISIKLYQKSQDDLIERNRLQEIIVKNLINTETMYATQQLLFNVDVLEDTLPNLLNFLSAALDETDFMLIVFNLADGELLYGIKSEHCQLDVATVFQDVTGRSGLKELTMPLKDLTWERGETRTLADGRKVLGAVVNRRGLLLAIRPVDAPDYEDGDHELVYTTASQIKIALENKLLDLQLRQHTQHLERLVDRRTSQLSVERKRLRAILDATAEGIFYMENFLIQYANPAFCRMVGYNLDDLYGKTLSHIRVSSDVNDRFNFNSLLSSPEEVEPGRSETRLRHRDGTEFYASIRFSLVGKPGENPVRMVAIARDISMERKLYFQRARFISNAAHELRTPLSSLILRLHMLRRQPERIQTHLESLDKVTDYLRDLVEELLTLSRFERGTISLDRDTFSLQALIQQAVNEHHPYAEEAQIQLELRMPDEVISARVDGTRIVQMVSNLVVNGINYNKPGGMVLIRMQVEKDPIGNRNAIIEVIDNGTGIEMSLLPDDIFEPFSRPSQGSRRETGMGLALAREIAHLHGGTIHARSTVDEGSTLRVNLPLE